MIYTTSYTEFAGTLMEKRWCLEVVEARIRETKPSSGLGSAAGSSQLNTWDPEGLSKLVLDLDNTSP
jgi:hypothetical protein